MSSIEAIISDFGGVLTSPLLDSFAAFQDSSGISLEELGTAMVQIAARRGANPLFELEKGRIRTVLSDAVWAAYRRTLELGARLEAETNRGAGERSGAEQNQPTSGHPVG